MDKDDALRVHSQLAYALLPFWRTSPQMQRVIHDQLKRWKRNDSRPSDFFSFIIRELEQDGVSCEQFHEAILGADQVEVGDLLRQMFNSAVAVAKGAYDLHQCWLGGAPQLDPGALIQPSAYPDAGACGALGAYGSTPKPGRGMDNAEVELGLVISLLGPPTWAAIPYVLIHELVCHASQASLSGLEIDPFTEGWMDEMARELHDANIVQIFGARESRQARDEGESLCITLRSIRPDLPEPDYAARSARVQGVAAAALTLSILEELKDLRAGETGWTLFAKLSVQLNTRTSTGDPRGDLARHQAFVGAVADIVANNESSIPRHVRAKAAYLAVLRKWVLDLATAGDVLSIR